MVAEHLDVIHDGHVPFAPTLRGSNSGICAKLQSITLTTHTWDFENQNTLVELPNASRVTIVYNADTQPIQADHHFLISVELQNRDGG